MSSCQHDSFHGEMSGDPLFLSCSTEKGIQDWMNNLPVSQMTSAYQGVIEQREDIFGSSANFSLGIDEDLNLESR